MSTDSEFHLFQPFVINTGFLDKFQRIPQASLWISLMITDHLKLVHDDFLSFGDSWLIKIIAFNSRVQYLKVLIAVAHIFTSIG